MTDPADDHDKEEEPAGEDSPPTPNGPPNRGRDLPIDPKALLPNLAAFQALQRDFFKLDVGALSSIQRILDNSPAAQISKMLDAQTAITRQFAQTVDFSQLVRTPALDAALKSNIANAAWVNSVYKSINLPELNLAFTQTAALLDAARVPSHLLDSITKQAQHLTSISDRIAAALPKFDFTDLLERLDRWIPTNLRDVEDLDLVATVALEDGIPVAWVPRPEIIAAVVEAATSEARIALLESRRDDILDDCDNALAGVDGEPPRVQWRLGCAALSSVRAALSR